MALCNTVHAYGAVAKWFHWGSALLFLASYITIYYREWFADSDMASWVAIQLHLSIGFSLAGIVLLRLIWRLVDRPAHQPEARRRVKFAAKAGHAALYLIMLLMPLSGYLSIANYLSSGAGSIRFFLLFDWHGPAGVPLPDELGLSLEKLESPAAALHHFLGAWLAWMLILGHAAAALYHHLVCKDDTLRRMLPSSATIKRKLSC